jgi:hypothetical protein
MHARNSLGINFDTTCGLFSRVLQIKLTFFNRFWRDRYNDPKPSEPTSAEVI